MATPAFIYACDDLGPDRFTELCGLLLGSRYKGFLLGGMGSDDGIDGEIDDILGEWYPETGCALLTELIQPHQLVIFQFKHKVTARVGQKEARRQLLALYTCTSQAHPCELHRLLQNKKPGAYVLLTNVEVNAQFRTKFIRACEQHCPAISHYQIIGLDELEMWVRSEVFVEDGINNVYSTIIPNDIVDWLLSYPEKTLKWPF